MALWLGTKLPSDRPVERSARLDTGGAALAIATLGTISYGLIALGFHVTYVVSNTVNFSQGSAMMLGAVLGYTFAVT